MNDTLRAVSGLAAWVRDHRDALVVGGLALTVLLLAWTVRKAIKSGRPDKWLSVGSVVVGFGWSAEAMWEIATQKLHLAASFAVFVFIVFEIQLATAMMRAERHQREHKHPGKYGRTAWLIAVVMGCVAAMAGDSPVEVALRLAVPLLVTRQWWDGLTGDGTDKPDDAITWTWSPRRVLISLGLARPGAQDLFTVDRQRQILALARVSHRLHSTHWRWRRAWYQMRLRRLSMTADDEMLDAARVHVERVWRSADRTRPITGEDLAVVAAARAEAEAARAEAEATRAEAEVARAAEAEAMARAEVEAAQAEAEATRRADLEAEAEVLCARVEAEATNRAKAEAEAQAARAEARAEALRASRVRGQADATAQEWRRRVETAESAAAQAAQALREEQQRRHRAEAQVDADARVLTEEQRRREAAETAARRQSEAHAAAQAELDELRQRLARAEAGTPRRARRTTEPAAEPLMFHGAPVPAVPGVGASTVLAVLQAREDHPDHTRKQLAEHVRVSDRTIRAVLAAVPDRDLAMAGT